MRHCYVDLKFLQQLPIRAEQILGRQTDHPCTRVASNRSEMAHFTRRNDRYLETLRVKGYGGIEDDLLQAALVKRPQFDQNAEFAIRTPRGGLAKQGKNRLKHSSPVPGVGLIG